MITVRNAAQAKRPRLWVPGVLFVAADGELVTGAHVGFNGRGPHFAKAKCGHEMSLTQWRHRAWLVERGDLDDEIVAQHAIILPESLLDPDQQPHARRWLQSQPLVCVSGAKVTRLLDAGLRVYTVEHGADDGILGLRAEGAEREGWALKVALADLVPPELAASGDPVSDWYQSEKLEVRTFVDRVLNEVSRGALREASVVNALAMRELVEPGYGYRGATFGDAAPVERVSHELRTLDELFGQIYARAREHRGAAKEIAHDMERVPEQAKSLDEIPVFQSARKVMLEQLVLPLPEGAYTRLGEAVSELVLPEQSRWFVERVAMWSPKLTDQQKVPEAPLDATAPPPWTVLVLTAVLVAIIAIGYVMTRG